MRPATHISERDTMIVKLGGDVDPMSDKYPSTSAYMYCVGNPVKLVDPSGKDSGVSIKKK